MYQAIKRFFGIETKVVATPQSGLEKAVMKEDMTARKKKVERRYDSRRSQNYAVADSSPAYVDTSPIHFSGSNYLPSSGYHGGGGSFGGGGSSGSFGGGDSGGSCGGSDGGGSCGGGD